jgi:septal ring factor EnvC (AmiA/AmiB activator)
VEIKGGVGVIEKIVNQVKEKRDYIYIACFVILIAVYLFSVFSDTDREAEDRRELAEVRRNYSELRTEFDSYKERLRISEQRVRDNEERISRSIDKLKSIEDRISYDLSQVRTGQQLISEIREILRAGEAREN